jgi:hypothetical protein
VAAGETATGVLADTTGATGAALTTGATEAALLTTGATGAGLTAATLVATEETAGMAETAEETAGTAEELAAVAVFAVAPTPPGLMAARLAVSWTPVATLKPLSHDQVTSSCPGSSASIGCTLAHHLQK